MLTQARLKELLCYDSETGIFTWRVDVNNRIRAGAVAGTLDAKGYIVIKINGRCYKAHRLSWLYIHGEFPPGQLDHANRTRADNRIANLRHATQCQNQKNRGSNANSLSGIKGVAWLKSKRKWVASAKLDGKRYHLGYFETAEAAAKAYNDFAKKHHGEFYYRTIGKAGGRCA